MIKIRNHKKSIFLFFVGLSLFSLFISSCDNNIVISESKTIETGLWNTNEVIELNAEIKQVEKFYNFFVEMDINEDFLTNNIWLFIHTQSPSGNTQSDTVMYYIADEKGKWFGDEKGEVIENKFLYKPNIRFSEVGMYQFNFQHGMREHDLPKVSKVGIRIEEVITETKKE